MKDDQTAPGREPASTARQSRTGPPHHILVVEDDIAIRQLITQVLSGAGYRVDEAEDGAAAWAALGAGTYNLLITDNQMPRLTGVELLEKLHAAGKALPVIMATGIVPAHVFARSPWLQPAATLLKPYTFEEMLGTVKKVLRATDSPSEQIAPPLNRQSQPLPEGLRLKSTDGVNSPWRAPGLPA